MYFVLNDAKCLFESMTKEQILAAITQAVSTHEISDVDTGFVTTIKEGNKSKGLKFWIGTQAEYNAIQTKELNCLYLITDDTELEDLEQAIEDIESDIENIESDIENIESNIENIESDIENIEEDLAVTALRARAAQTKINDLETANGQILLDQQVAYGSNYSIQLTGDIGIKKFSIVKVMATGAGEILCTVHKDESDNVTIKGCGFANISGTSGATIVNVNLTCSKEQNILKTNRSTFNVITSSGASFGEQEIFKIIGVY